LLRKALIRAAKTSSTAGTLGEIGFEIFENTIDKSCIIEYDKVNFMEMENMQ
jgi:hypothetical protein